MKRFAIALAACLCASTAEAGVTGRAAQELAEFVMKKFGKSAAAEGAERLAGRIASAAARHGDDVVSAVRKVGPRAIALADDAGKDAPSVLRLLSHYGDDAARVLGQLRGLALVSRYGDEAAAALIKHKGVAEPLIESFGQPAVRAFGTLGPQAGRRLAILADELPAIGRTPELLDVIARHGDAAMEFVWKHKGVLAGSAALAAFLADPEPYLKGTADLTRVAVDGAGRVATVVAENAVKPAVIAAGDMAKAAAVAAAPPLFWMVAVLAAVLAVLVKALRWWPVRTAVKVAGKAAAEAAFKKG